MLGVLLVTVAYANGIPRMTPGRSTASGFQSACTSSSRKEKNMLNLYKQLQRPRYSIFSYHRYNIVTYFRTKFRLEVRVASGLFAKTGDKWDPLLQCYISVLVLFLVFSFRMSQALLKYRFMSAFENDYLMNFTFIHSRETRTHVLNVKNLSCKNFYRNRFKKYLNIGETFNII